MTRDLIIAPLLLLLVAVLGYAVGSGAALPVRQERDWLQRSLEHCRGEQRAAQQLRECIEANRSCSDAIREVASQQAGCKRLINVGVTR